MKQIVLQNLMPLNIAYDAKPLSLSAGDGNLLLYFAGAHLPVVLTPGQKLAVEFELSDNVVKMTVSHDTPEEADTPIIVS